MSTQNIQVGQNGPTVILSRQMGDACTTRERSDRTTTIECSDIEMALIGPMVQLHANKGVTADVEETKTGSINNELDYQTSDSYILHGDAGTLAPGAHKHFTDPDTDSPDWYLGLDGKLGNSGTARIILTATS